MLTRKELKMLRDQDAAIGGAPIFESVWRDRAIAEAFIDWARRDQFATWVDWMERTPAERLATYYFEKVTDLELALRDLVEVHALFLEACPDAVREDAVHRARAALGTAPPKKPRPRAAAPCYAPALLRRAHRGIDRLWAAHDRNQPAARADLEELRATLAELGRDEVADVDALLAAPAPERMAVYTVIYMLRVSLPYHAPLVRQLRHWLADANRDQRASLRVLAARWLERLGQLPDLDRHEAAGLIRRAIKSPKLTDEREALLATLERVDDVVA